MSRFRGAIEASALVFAALLLCAVVGALNPLPRPGVTTDTLGPDNGDTVDEYVARGVASVDEARGDEDSHWSLVSFRSAVSPEAASRSAADVRIAQVLFRVPIERVQTQVIAVGVPGTESSVVESEDIAASRLQGSMGQWDRQSQIDAASSTRLAAGCDCVVGIVVHATGDALARIADGADVRAVEVLPSDAIAGKFAVRALLPEYIGVIEPLPDDGPIPPP